MSRRTKIIIGVVALVVVVGIVAAVTLQSRGTGPEVETATVSEKQLAVTVSASGKVEAGLDADIYPPTAGTLSEIFVAEGTSVTAGTKVAQMDTAPLELQVAQARAALSQARAQLAGIDDQAAGPADLTAAQANVDAAYQSYTAAQTALNNISSQGPSSSQIAAAEAGTDAAYGSYQNAQDLLDALEALPPSPSTETSIAVAQAQRDAAYAAYLSAKAAEEQLKSTSLSTARAQAEAGVDQAYAGYKGAQAQLAKLQGASSSEQKAAAAANVKQSAEALALAQDNLEKATFVAPIDGVLIYNSALGAAAAAAGAPGGSGKPAEGSAVQPGAAPFTVVDLDALKFSAEVDEADVDRVKVGMKTVVSLDAFPSDEFVTTVARINPVAQATATGGTIFQVEMGLTDTGKEVLIGMKGDSTIEVSAEPSALTIPVEALFTEGGTNYVYVVQENKLKKTEITIGATTDTEVEVLSGLTEGQVVALSGSTQYTDGMAVRVKQ